MFTRPTDVTDADLIAVLADGWGVEVVTLDYLAVGFGSHHWRATTASTEWFVTVDDLVAKRHEPGEPLSRTRERLLAALVTSAAVRDAGYDFAVAPIRTDGGRIARDFEDRYVVAVYPLVNGRTYDYGNYTDAVHREAVVRNVAALHLSPIECRRWALTDTLSIPRRAELSAACSQLNERWDSGPFAQPAKQLLVRHANALAGVLDRYDALAAGVSSHPERFVLTHGEPHPANTISTDERVLLVDWDTVLIAPPERDLWDLVDDDASVAGLYESLTGVELDRHTLSTYRLAWDLSEIAIYVSDFLHPHEHTDDTAEAWQNLQHFLDPTRWLNTGG